jgi:hypothetical protein
LRRVFLTCTRGPKHTAAPHSSLHESKRRNTVSKRIGCPASLWVICGLSGLWGTKPMNSQQHNHEPAEVIAIPKYRRKTQERMRSDVFRLYASGVKSRWILQTLAARGEPFFSSVTIYVLWSRKGHQDDSTKLLIVHVKAGIVLPCDDE